MTCERYKARSGLVARWIGGPIGHGTKDRPHPRTDDAIRPQGSHSGALWQVINDVVATEPQAGNQPADWPGRTSTNTVPPVGLEPTLCGF
jgi:hypothetical protein